MLIHVTGARGLVGSQVTKALAQLGEVHGTDVDDMDVANPDRVMETLSAHPPDVLVHLAALKGNQPSRKRPVDFFRVNTAGTLNLLEACRQLGIKQFIFLSSLTVHGPGNGPVNESSPWAPLHPYAGSKGAAESMVQAYANSYGLQAVAFRPNFIVGPIPPPQPYVDNIIYDFIEAIHQSGAIELAGEGQFQREWLHPKDIAHAVSLAVSRPRDGFDAYILSGHRTTMRELAERIILRVGGGEVVTNPQRDGFSLISTSEKAEQELGWRPQVPFDCLLDEIWDEYRTRFGIKDHSHHRD